MFEYRIDTAISRITEPGSHGFNIKLLEKQVYRAGARPKCDSKWPSRVNEVLGIGWAADVSKRPSMDVIVKTLQEEINSKSEYEIEDILDASQKSEMSMRKSIKQK